MDLPAVEGSICSPIDIPNAVEEDNGLSRLMDALVQHIPMIGIGIHRSNATYRRAYLESAAASRREYFRTITTNFDSYPTIRQRRVLRRRIHREHLIRNGLDTFPERPSPSQAAGSESSAPDTDYFFRLSRPQHKTMQTIKEESSLSTRRGRPIRKAKDLEDKVASLQVLVSRLHKLCLEKPKAVEGTISEETIQQFKEIKL